MKWQPPAFLWCVEFHWLSSMWQSRTSQLKLFFSELYMVFFYIFMFLLKLHTIFCVCKHFHIWESVFQQNISCPYLLSSTPPFCSCCLVALWQITEFTPPTFLVLSLSPSLAAMLVTLAASITTPQHVPGSLGWKISIWTLHRWSLIPSRARRISWLEQ